ncbi:MAG: DUF3617 family protein [Betaproteobacteria bacterium]|nr:DUF3617 family protein [Betaproteobacteria bacterium]
MHRAFAIVPAITAMSAVAAIAAAAALAPSALAQELPKRKSGLWEIRMESGAGKGGGGGHLMTQCVDQSRDDAFRQMGQQMERENKCTRTNVQRGPNRLSFDSSCDFGTMKTTAKTVITGDFNSAYKMEIQSRYEPPMMGLKEGTTVMEAKWTGACKPGQRPGDVTVPGGMTMNIYDMMDAKKK